MFDYNFSINSLSILLCILVLCYAIFLRRQLTRQTGTIEEQTQYVEAVQKKIKFAESLDSREKSFENDLKQASVTTEFQKPRSAFMKNRKGQRAPERYQYATSMFRSGMPKDEISQALGMSLTELSQLITLSSLCADKKRLENQ